MLQRNHVNTNSRGSNELDSRRGFDDSEDTYIEIKGDTSHNDTDEVKLQQTSLMNDIGDEIINELDIETFNNHISV